MVHYAVLHTFAIFSIWQLFGLGGLKFQLVYTLLGVFWIEAVNYLEHYGLGRIKDKDGIYETIGVVHSWNAVSSPVAYRLQRHSDHHAHLYRPF